MKSKHISIKIYILFLVAFALGAGVLAYPAVSSWFNDLHQSTEVGSYQNSIEKLDETDYSAYFDAAHKYNEALLASGTMLTDPFDYEIVRNGNGSYENMLNYSKIMATIEIPEIKVNLPVYHGTEKETLSEGIGHLESTSLPVGGIGTHCVLTGHTGFPGKKLFTDVSKLEIGDVFYVHVMNETLTYQIDDISVILPKEVEKLVLEPDKDYVTLLTCTPYGVNDHRLLVRGERIFPEKMPPEEQEVIQKNTEEVKTLSMVEKIEFCAGCVAVLLFIIMLIMMISAIRDNRRQDENES